MDLVERATGCLIGSAYGDSLGAAVEFLSLAEIRARYGPTGIIRLDPVYGLPPGAITDDTQMALATAEGIIRAPAGCGNDELVREIWMAYRAWFDTQRIPSQRRAPGNTCLSALSSDRMGSRERPLNSSAGCGAVMRAHPLGIALPSPEAAFELGVLSGALTHGHPNGYVPAGFLAAIITRLMEGSSLSAAISLDLERLREAPETYRAITAAVTAATISRDAECDPSRVIEHEIGGDGGWQGHYALGIALYAVLVRPHEPLQAVELAVNHSGDSDSTGAIAGAIMGAIHGPETFYAALSRQHAELEHTHRLRYLAGELVRSRSLQ